MSSKNLIISEETDKIEANKCYTPEELVSLSDYMLTHGILSIRFECEERYESSCSLQVYFNRYETEQEKQKRLEGLNRFKEEQYKKKLEMFEKLKKELGK